MDIIRSDQFEVLELRLILLDVIKLCPICLCILYFIILTVVTGLSPRDPRHPSLLSLIFINSTWNISSVVVDRWEELAGWEMVLTYNYDTTRPGKGKELFIRAAAILTASIASLGLAADSEFSARNISTECFEERNVSNTRVGVRLWLMWGGWSLL